MTIDSSFGLVRDFRERRKSFRVPLTELVRIRVFNDSGVECYGITENASLDGMLLLAERTIAVGSKLHVLLRLVDRDSEPELQIWYFGQVVRARQLLSGRCALATAFSDARIHNGTETEVWTTSS